MEDTKTKSISLSALDQPPGQGHRHRLAYTPARKYYLRQADRFRGRSVLGICAESPKSIAIDSFCINGC
eukprot:IDg14461t1